MDSGGNMQSNEERGAEKLMDGYLKSLGLHRKRIAKDGSCLFRAVAEQVLHSQSLHTEVRAKCVEFLKQNRDIYEAFIEGDFEDYLLKLQDPQQWVGEVEINALAVMYKRDFVIYQEPGRPAVNITDNNFKDKVQLCFLNGNHYDSVYDCSHIKNAALCQSILYELLYEGVFKADHSLRSLCNRTSRFSDFLSDDNMNICGSSDESDVDVSQPLWVENETNTQVPRHNRGRGRGRVLPERVRRSLNPTLYRNIEYDVWHKTKRAQQKMDYCIAAGMQFTTGDRCQVRLEGRNYNAVIKEVSPDNGPVTVYVEELGSRRQVPLWNLRPPSDENSWSTVVNRDKRLSNGHGDWEERGKGRGRGKHVTASPSVSQATAPSSTGRIQKQHSWPMQATVDEHGGVKANRKAVSPVESAFGLTEEQRLAKEEEERNVALVEIQLRDEHSFPALGTQPGLQGDGGKKKLGDKRKSQRNKTKSPVEDIRAPSPSAGERPKSSSPPLTAPTVPPTNTTTPANPAPPAAKPPAAVSVNSDSSSTWPSPFEASPPNIKMAGGVDASAAVTSSSSVSACEAPATKTSGNSYASAAGAPQSSPAAATAPSTKPSVPPSIPSSASLFSLLPPVLPAASSPPTPQAVSSSSPPPSASSKLVPSSSSSLPPKSSASPPPSSTVPPPTFIAPIAPTPAAAQGFLPRSSPPVSSVCHSTSPPSSSSSSLIHHAAQVHETPSVSAQHSLKSITQSASQTSQTSTSPSQTHPQVPQPQNQSRIPVTQSENRAQPSLPPHHTLTPQVQTEASVPESRLPHLQHQPQSHTEVASLSQVQTQPSVLQTSVPQSQAEVAQVQPSHPPAEAPYPNISQASVPVSASVQPQTSVPHPHPHVHLAQPPHPSQVPHPSLSLSASPTHPPLQPQTHHTQDQTEVPPAPTQPQPDSPPHPPHPSHHPYLESAHPPPPPPPPPPHPPSIPAVVPLQQLSQLYQDPLYPGFPQGEKGEVAPTPVMSCSTSGDDLPKDINILKFFFNLGVKAYSMPMYAPYIYLLPLQHAHAMHPKLPSRSPSPSPTPHYPPANTPTRHQEAYAHPQYPPTSSSMAPQYNHQAPPTEPSNPSDTSFSQGMYPVTQTATPRMPGSSLPWQQHQMPQPRNPSFQVGYPTPSPPYPVAPPPLCQSYHPGQGQGHPLYRPSVPQYPPSSLGYQTSAAQEELQVSQGSMEQHQPTNGDTMPGRGPIPAAANLAIATNNRAGFAVKNEQGDGLTRTVLLVDPPLNNKPILVSNPGIDVPASMTTMKMSSAPGSSLTYDIISKTTGAGDSNPSRGYRAHPKIPNPTNAYVPLAAPEPGQMGYGMVVAEPLSVGCNTEDDWEEQGFKPATSNYRAMRRGHRGGGRGRGGYDQGRGSFKRRHGGEAGPVPGYTQYNSSYRGRGRDKGY